jgi:prolyl oligopeptidase
MPERAAIRARLKELWNFPKFGLPQKRGGRLFYTKNDGLQNQAVTLRDRRPGPPRGSSSTRTRSRADGTVAVTDVSPTDDGRLLGYGLAVAGSDWTEFHVRDVRRARTCRTSSGGSSSPSLSWTHDGAGFFYSRYPEVAPGDKLFGKLLGRQLYYHRLGTEQSADRLVFEIPEHPEWFFNGEVTDDGRYLVIEVEQNGKTQNALYYVDLGDPSAPRSAPRGKAPRPVRRRLHFVGNTGPRLPREDDPRARPGARWSRSTLALARPGMEDPGRPVRDSIEEAVFGGGWSSSRPSTTCRAASRSSGRRRLPREVALPGIGAVSGLSGKGRRPRGVSTASPPSSRRRRS